MTANPYAPHDRAFRPMTHEDINSARRGLQMQNQSHEALGRLIDQHSTIDAFASKVIIEAAHREIDDRWVRHEID